MHEFSAKGRGLSPEFVIGRRGAKEFCLARKIRKVLGTVLISIQLLEDQVVHKMAQQVSLEEFVALDFRSESRFGAQPGR